MHKPCAQRNDRYHAKDQEHSLSGRRTTPLQQTADAIRTAGGVAVPVVADVSLPADIETLMETVKQAAGPIDLLVHNAAWVHGGNLASTTLDDWRRLMATNLDSAYFLARGAMDLMLPRKRGVMVFVSTIGARQAHHGMTGYDASKGGVESFVRSLALELAPAGIRVNGIAPGAIQRDAHERTIEASVLHQPYVPMLRRGVPAEIASVVAFLASVQASYITGQILAVDGGATAQLSPRGAFI